MPQTSRTKWFLASLPSLFLGLLLLLSRIDPRLFWVFTILNPLVPGLLLLLFLLVLWQFYRRQHHRAILSLSILLLAFPLLQQTIAWASPAVATAGKEDMAFSLASANVYSFKAPQQNNYPLDSAAIKDFVDLLSADVVALQEYDYKATNWRTKWIMEQGKLPYVQKIEKGALVVFSRWPIQVVEERLLQNNVNGYQIVDIQHPATVFRLINIHLKSNQITHIADQLQEKKKISSRQNRYKLLQMFSRYGRSSLIRTEQATLIANLVNQSPLPLVVLGDMNEVPTAYPYRQLMRSQKLQDCWLAAGRGLGATFAGTLPGLRIDYILADTALQVQTIQVLPEGDGDHHPLKASLRFKK